MSNDLPEEHNDILVSPARRQKSYGALLARQNIDATSTKIGLATCLTNKKGRRELAESAYNRHTFYVDEVNLPKWFQDEEREHCQPTRPLTSEQIAQIKGNLIELNQRPRTKKEREALARKRTRATAKLSAAQEKTQQIILREDLTEREKIKQIKQVQGKQEIKKTRVVYSNRSKEFTGRRKAPHGVKLVDTRGKKELRAEKRRATGGKGKGSRGSKGFKGKGRN